MSKSIAGAVLLSLAVFAYGVMGLVPRSEAAIIPLRSGTVVSKTDAGIFTHLKAVDAAGEEFWIVTSICTIGEKGKVAVLAGTRYDKIKSSHLNTVLEDAYTAQRLRVGDLEVPGFGAHGLPDGCVTLR